MAIRQQHTSYHESSAKKINYKKLDPSLAFCFLLKKPEDLQTLRDFMQNGKAKYRGDWLFYCKEQKDLEHDGPMQDLG